MTNYWKWLLSVLLVLSIVGAGANHSTVSAQAAPFTDGTYDDTATGIIYTSGWEMHNDRGAVGGSDISTSQASENARFEFSGSQITIIYSKTVDSGLFQVTIDGTIYEFDAFSPETEYHVQWISPVLASGTHNVVIQKKDQDGKAIYFDGLIVSSTAASPAPTQDPSQAPYTPTPSPSLLPPTITTTPVQPASTPTLVQGAGSVKTAGNGDLAVADTALTTTYDDKDPAFVYSSGWYNGASSTASGGFYHYTSINGSYATFKFTGTGFSVIYRGAPPYRTMIVYLDGTNVGTINQQRSTVADQLRWDYPGTLTNAQHLLKLVFATSTSGTYGSIDGVLITSSSSTAPTPTAPTPTAPTPTAPTPIAPTPTAPASTVNVYSGQSIMTSCVNVVSAGATCVVNTGTYNEAVTINKALTLVCNGTCVVTGGFNITGSYVTVRGFEAKNRGIRVAGAYNTIEQNYIHDLTYAEPGVLMYNTSVNHIVVRNNRIYRANNACIQTTGNNNSVDSNDCSNTKQPTTNGDANCFSVFGGNHLFAGNWCHDLNYGAAGYNYSAGDYINDAHVDCFQTWNWVERGGAVRDSVFRANFCDVPSKGSTATAKAFQATGRTSSGTIDTTKPYPCRNLTFVNNVIHSNLYGIFNYCENITLKYNTFVSDVISGTQGLHFFSMRGSNVIQYNIFVDADDGAFVSLDTVSKPTLMGGYNVIYVSDGVPRGTKLTGDLWDVDPMFIDRTAKNYHLRAGSPACGRGAYSC
jgi:hypothetical protein